MLERCSLGGEQLGELLCVLALCGHKVVVSEGAVCGKVHELHAGNGLQVGLNPVVPNVCHLAHKTLQARQSLQR